MDPTISKKEVRVLREFNVIFFSLTAKVEFSKLTVWV